MKLGFKDLSIKSKIIFLIISISALSFLLSATVFFIYDRSEFKAKTLRDMSILAEVTGYNNAANLNFPLNGKKEASHSLQSLDAEKYVTHAVIFDHEGNAFAQYRKDTANTVILEKLPLSKDTSIFKNGYLTITKPIAYKGNIDGVIYIKASLDEYQEKITRFITIIFIILLLSSLLAFILSQNLHKIISKPILHLAEIMKLVSETKDFSIRATKMANDEIGDLNDGFNQMLGHIETQNKDLKKAKEHAEHSLKVKEQFLANMSHEIRTPMNAIMGMASLLMDTNLSNNQYTYLDNIKVSADNLLVIINDILDFSKIEAGKLELEDSEFDLYDLFNRFKNTFRFSADKKGLGLSINIDSDVPQKVIGDPVRLNQIIVNLAGNAIKFTEEGRIDINLEVLKENKTSVVIKFLVIDTGIGIGKEKIETIFSSFSQASSSTTRKYGGTGLGLTISKQLVELQNGKIGLESELGKGSTFWFTIPYKKVEKTNEVTKKQIRNMMTDVEALKEYNKNIRVLIAEDNKINQLFASTILKKHNYQVIDIAENGQIAIDLVQNNDYDIILMDLHMPQLDGYDATKKIRNELPSDKQNIPIIALTAAATKGETDKCYEVGMNDYISKPFKPEILLEKIINLTYNKNNMDAPKQTDLSYLENMSGGSSEIMKEMIELFISQIPEFVNEFNKALEAKNWKELSGIAHKAKSSISIVGMNELAEHLKNLEIDAKNEKNIENYPQAVRKFEKKCELAKQELENILKTL